MSANKTDTTKPHARLIRENEQLLKVASAAMKLRRIGQLADEYQDNIKTLWDERPDMTRSGTGAVMYAQAYETALENFDKAVLEAASTGMDWAQDHKIEMKAVQDAKQG